MTRKRKPTAPTVRPYWIPPGVAFEELPEAVRIAFQAIVEPAYGQLVLGAGDPLERAAGSTLAFLAALEICDQLELAQQLIRTNPPDAAAPAAPGGTAERDKLISRHLRLVAVKQNAATFIARLQDSRAKRELAAVPLGFERPPKR
jgi:hypothetical protein